MREMRRISVGMREISVGIGKIGGNAENQGWNSGNLRSHGRNAGNQGYDAGNQGGNLSVAVEMTENSTGNDKFKARREVKIIENEHTFSFTYLIWCLSC